MRRRQVLALTPLVISLRSFGKDKTDLSGFWEVGLPDTGTTSASNWVVQFEQKGSVLDVKDLSTGQKYRGTIINGEFKFPINVKPATAEGKVSVMLEGSVKAKGVLNGTATVAGQTKAWAGTSLVSLWLCSNHDPNHYAKSKEEMQKLTAEHKCGGWHRPA